MAPWFPGVKGIDRAQIDEASCTDCVKPGGLYACESRSIVAEAEVVGLGGAPPIRDGAGHVPRGKCAAATTTDAARQDSGLAAGAALGRKREAQRIEGEGQLTGGDAARGCWA